MAAEIINGKQIAAQIRSELKEQVERMAAKVADLDWLGPCRDNPLPRCMFARRKACHEIGIYSEEHKLPGTITQGSCWRSSTV